MVNLLVEQLLAALNEALATLEADEADEISEELEEEQKLFGSFSVCGPFEFQ